MTLSGLSDSLASVIVAAPACPRCDSCSHVAGGLCVGCLLQSGLDPGDMCEAEALISALAEINLPDQNWRLGNYEILEEIGRGGMGVIYRARQRHSRRIVAVKRVLSYHSDSRETLARFRREAQAAASLDHPNILPIYEVSESEDGLPFFSMKFAPGGNLQEVGPALRNDPRQCVALVAKVARAVQYAHAKGILHRDLKPGNILLDARGEPLVSDFGLAKWLDTTSDLTRTLTIFGTPGYIAPEQASGPAADLKPSADVYSLGAILFDLLAGRPPFLGAHALSVIRQAAESPAPKLRTLSKIADRDLETICAHCLERDPKLRYPSAHDLATDLERWLEGRPIIARPVLPPVRVWRWTRRNRKLAVSLAASVLIGSAAVLWQAETRRLGHSVREAALAARSIAILPVLDLDSAEAAPEITRALGAVLQEALEQTDPTSVRVITEAESWLAGTAVTKDVTAIAVSTKSRFVLTGTRRRSQDKMRVTLRVFNGSSGEIILHGSFEVSSGGATLATQLRNFASKLDAVIRSGSSENSRAAADPGLRNAAAREFLVSGRQLQFRNNVADSDRAISCFERALQLEPDSAIAHAYLASALAGRHHYAPDAKKLQRAEAEARVALRLQQDSADAHRALAGVLYQQGDLLAAKEEQLLTVEYGGTEERIASFIGMTLAATGEPTRALRWLQMAQHFATLPGDYDNLIGNCWALLLEDAKAEATYQRAVELRPDAPDGWVGLAHLKMRQGDFEAARALCREYRSRFETFPDPDSDARKAEALIEFIARNYASAELLYGALLKDSQGRDGGHRSATVIECETILARLLQLRGEEDLARAKLRQAREDELQRGADPNRATHHQRLAAIEAGLGNTTSAIEQLQLALDAGWLDIRSLRRDPRFDALVGDAVFHQLLEAIQARLKRLREQKQDVSVKEEIYE